jgi:hypothetical protein
MISGDDDFVPVWQLAEPIIEVDNCLHVLGKHREIASMNEDVAIRHVDLAMKLMSIADEDKAQCGSRRRRSAWLQVPSHTWISGAGRVLGKIGHTILTPLGLIFRQLSEVIDVVGPNNVPLARDHRTMSRHIINFDQQDVVTRLVRVLVLISLRHKLYDVKIRFHRTPSGRPGFARARGRRSG